MRVNREVETGNAGTLDQTLVPNSGTKRIIKRGLKSA
jgi:hypothetical protein